MLRMIMIIVIIIVHRLLILLRIRVTAQCMWVDCPKQT